MPLPLVPILVVGVLPLALLGVAFRLFEKRWFRGAFLVVLAGALALSWPRHGLDFDVLKKMSLFLAGGAALVLLLRHLGVPWALDATKRVRAFAALAAAAVVVYTNFFAFHGEGVFVHLHDVAHYYLGSKYFGELSYTNLYTAMIRAEAEKHEGRFRSPVARDLVTNEVVPVTTLLLKSEEVKAAFTP